MSVSGPLSGIRFTGLGSGLDVESIVTQLIRLEQIPIQRFQAQQAQLQARQTVFGEFKSKLNALNSAASSLSFANTFNPSKATAADSTILGVSASDSAAAGTYSVNVTRLAKAHKVATTAQASTTDALGQTGSFMINGKAVTVESTDTLTTLASKINSTNSGVTATLLNGGAGQAFLVVNANKTGAANSVAISDISGGVMGSLGLLNGSTSFSNLVDADTARSRKFSSGNSTLQSLTGSAMSGTFSLGGTNISVDFAADSLQTIADKINLAGGGNAARIVTETKDSVTTSRLEIDSASIPASVTDSDGILKALGVMQNGFGNQLVGAQDAQATIDSVTVTSETNSLGSVVQGLTVNLLKEGATEITVTRDTSKVKDSIKNLMTAYNGVVDYIRTNSSLDSETFRSGPLFGDQTVAQVENTLSSLIFQSVGTGAVKNLADLGFSFDDQSKLTLDEAKLDSRLATDLDAVKNMMLATGSSASSSLRYVSSNNKTVASGGAGYSVDITQVATKTTFSGTVAQTLPNVGGEVLSFTGSLFGGSTIDLSVGAGASLTDLISSINSDSRLKDLVTASNDGGTLKLESKRFGTAGRFSVASNLTAGADNSGIGSAGVAVNGVDVAGTINGEAATGSGQFLMGNTGNSSTEGLQIQYTGTTTGAIGTVSFSRGIASLLNYRMESFTDSVNGLLTTVDKALTDQIEDLNDRITSTQERLVIREETLRKRFTAMEEAIGRLNAQSSQFGAVFGGGG